MKAELFYKSTDILGEGVMWHPSRKCFFWVDIIGRTLNEIDLNGVKSVSYRMPSMVSTVVPDKDGNVILALSDRIVRFDIGRKILTDLVPLESNNNRNRSNDGKCDAVGRFWIGTMSLDGEKGAGRLYTFGKGEPLRIKLDNQSIPNGIVWNKDNTLMYYIDTIDSCVKEYAYNIESGAIKFQRIAIEVSEEMGSPDGMTIDERDMLWIALWGGGAVGCWNPVNGELIEKIDIPSPYVTSCAFGGDDYKILIITTARYNMTAEELSRYPLSGSLFVCRNLSKGRYINSFSQ